MTIAVTAPTRSRSGKMRVRGVFHEIMEYLKRRCEIQRPRKTV